MMTPCVVCCTHATDEHPPPQAQRGLVCDHHRAQVPRQLEEILTWTAAADAHVMPSGGQGDHATGKPGSRPPLNVSALDAALGIDALAVLEDWERAVREDFDLAPYGVATAAYGASLGRTVDFLLVWWPRLADSWPPVDELAREINDTHRGLRRWHPDHDQGATRIQCPVEDCGRWLIVHPEDFDAEIRCRCGASWTVARVLRVVESTRAAIWVDPGTASWRTGIPERTLRDWAAAGKIDRHRGRYDMQSIRRFAEVREADTP